MNTAKLDWAHAWTGGVAEAPSAATAFIERLRNEIPVLPFLSLPFAEELTAQIEVYEPYLRSFRHMLLLGIGGSALGPRALQKAFAPAQDRPGCNGPWLWIADNVQPDWLSEMLAKLPPKETIVVVISKSGGTIETMAQYLLVLPWLQKSLPEEWRDHLFMITDSSKGFLRDEANKYALRSLPVPDNLGGRYSVLSAVGLVPAAFLGIDWKGLLNGAMSVGRPLAQAPETLPDHPAWHLAQWAWQMSKAGKSQVIYFCYIPSWSTFGPWFCQLWAESLGKDGRGTMPIPATGVTDQHSLLQMFLDGPADKTCLFVSAPADTSSLPMPQDLPPQWNYLNGHSFGDILEAETLATRATLAQKNVPVVHVSMPDDSPYSAGKMMMLMEAATIFTGWLLGINPIDQPAVETGKKLARARLGMPGSESDAQRLAAFTDTPSVFQPF
ncbi:MAG: glucose-6-phosphate isomerase [Mailhella sp.]|nr:glucose-6-phosphate isomerase [Mailhella sp.]